MRRRDLLASLAALPLAAAAARAQGAYPARNITIVNGYGPGGSTDVTARLVMEGMAARLGAGVPIVIENRPGASGTVASEWLRRQPADGYTLMLSESSSFAIWPAMHAEGMRYRPVEDFSWIATLCTSPLVFIVSPQFPAATLAEALEVLRSPRSETLDYSSSGPGSIPHIAAELLRHLLGSKARHSPYRGGAPAVLSIAKGETAWGVAALGSAAGQIKGGLVRALAVTSPTRHPLVPDVPSFTEVGAELSGMALEIYYLLHAPAGLAPAVVENLNLAAAGTLADADVRQRFLTAGMKAWEGPNTPASTTKVVTDEFARFKAIAARTGIKISS
ncbi:MAG: tripartite tricarboxylate transporter substrate binding protein [Variibacter sp.]|nr:tripartite tricarboxylate transporter substrate binding protein [Variibacter sp.]